MDIWERLCEAARAEYGPREFFMQLDEANEAMEIMVDYEKRQTVTLGQLMPQWWGRERYAEANRQD